MYRRIHNILSQTTHWRSYDVFKRQKDSTFRKSKRAICELAARYRGLVEECQRGLGSKEARKLLFVLSPAPPCPLRIPPGDTYRLGLLVFGGIGRGLTID